MVERVTLAAWRIILLIPWILINYLSFVSEWIHAEFLLSSISYL